MYLNAMKISSELKKMLEERGKGQAWLCRKYKLKRQYYNQYLNGKLLPEDNVLMAISNELHLDIDALKNGQIKMIN